MNNDITLTEQFSIKKILDNFPGLLKLFRSTEILNESQSEAHKN